MSSHKDLWFNAMVERENELIDQGIDPDVAYERASEEAHGIVSDRLADMADNARQRAKDEGQ